MTLLNEKPYFYFVILKEEMFIFYRNLTLLLMMSLFGLHSGEVKLYFHMGLLILGELSFYLNIILMVKFLSHTFRKRADG